jgi:hypothetical protein
VSSTTFIEFVDDVEGIVSRDSVGIARFRRFYNFDTERDLKLGELGKLEW